MKVNTIHIKPFDFIQIIEFHLSRPDTFKLLVNFGNAKLQILCLIRYKAKFWNISVCVLTGIIIASFSCEKSYPWTCGLLTLFIKEIDWIIFTLYYVSAQLRSQIKRDWHSSLQNVLFELKIELIPCNLFNEFTRINSVEFDRKVELINVFVFFQLSRKPRVSVKPVLCWKIIVQSLINWVIFSQHLSLSLPFVLQHLKISGQSMPSRGDWVGRIQPREAIAPLILSRIQKWI